MLSEILTKPERPDLPLQYKHSSNIPSIAWKTGTSYGRRDAWSIGYNQRFTVGVWVGNADGTGAPELVGGEAATPLLFKIFRVISPQLPQQDDWLLMPEELDFRFVCTESGLPPAPFCEQEHLDFFLPGVSPSQECAHKKTFFTNTEETITYCTACLPNSGYKQKAFSVNEPEILAYLEQQNLPYTKIPLHNPKCTRVFSGEPPVITSPSDQKEYILLEDGAEIMLSCQATAGVEYVYWYVDDQLLTKAKATENVFFSPRRGKVKVSCSDDKGRNSDIMVTVI
jgi:penicillin-binding protein 1C